MKNLNYVLKIAALAADSTSVKSCASSKKSWRYVKLYRAMECRTINYTRHNVK